MEGLLYEVSRCTNSASERAGALLDRLRTVERAIGTAVRGTAARCAAMSPREATVWAV